MLSLLTRAGARTRRTLAMSTLVFASLGAAACGDDDDPTGTDGISGTFALQEIDGGSLPQTFTDDDDNVYVVTGGTLLMDDDGSWQLSVNGTVNGTAQEILADDGSYDLNGNDLDFHSDAFGDDFSGTASDDERDVTFTYDIDGDGTADVEFFFSR